MTTVIAGTAQTIRFCTVASHYTDGIHDDAATDHVWATHDLTAGSLLTYDELAANGAEIASQLTT